MLDFNSYEEPGPQRVKMTRELDRSSLRTLGLYSMVVFLFALFSIIYCWERQTIITRGYKIEQLKKDQAAVEELGRKLLLDRAALRAPQRIDAYARQHLGLVPPPSNQVIFRNKKDLSKSPDNLLALERIRFANP